MPSTDPEPDQTVTAEPIENTAQATSAVVLSLGTGLLNIRNCLWCILRQNQRASTVLDHHVVFDPDSQAPEALWYLVIVLRNVQSYKYDWNESVKFWPYSLVMTGYRWKASETCWRFKNLIEKILDHQDDTANTSAEKRVSPGSMVIAIPG